MITENLNEAVYNVKESDSFLAGRAWIDVEVEGGPVTLWPLNLRIEGDGQYTFRMLVEDDFFRLVHGEEVLVQDLAPIFALMDGNFTLVADNQETKINATMRDQSGQTIADGIERQSGNIISRFAEAQKFEATGGRILLQVKISKPSQLCIDLHRNGRDYADVGLVFQYNGSDPSGAHVNVWRDVMNQGVFIRDLRKKLGYFPVSSKNLNHTLLITVRAEGAKGRIGVMIKMDDGTTKVLSHAEHGIIDITEFDYVTVRETPGSGGEIGKYEVEKVG